jgi:hypothetical protein
MKTFASSRTSRRRKPHGMQPWWVLLGGLWLGAGIAAAAEEPKQAVWKIKEAGFSYHSSNAIYSCSALQARVENILLAVGARDDLQVKVTGCNEFVAEDGFDLGQSRSRDAIRDRDIGARPSGWEDPYDRFSRRRNEREQSAYVRVRLQMPVELTPDVLDEVKRDKSRRELVSRLTRDPASKLDDPIVFPARWQSVTLSRDSIGLKPEECELLDQVSTSIFKQLDLRVTGKSRGCNRDGVSRIPPTLTVQALLSAPIGATSLPQIPIEESKSDPPAAERE